MPIFHRCSDALGVKRDFWWLSNCRFTFYQIKSKCIRKAHVQKCL